MIISNSKYSMSETKTSAYSVHMKLVIMNLQKQDLGGYKCISKNSIGDAEGNIRLYDMELPKHTKKIGDRRGAEEDTNDSINERDHNLNRIYQGSLREAGSTLDPSAVGREDSASSTSSPTERRRNGHFSKSSKADLKDLREILADVGNKEEDNLEGP
ncbi:hypothetical protein HZH68_014301 [Vespula germanica]|uniref:Immunoglobulin I-set domain-containing protein n=1 Tax=Vespula germanica TaxID=30212 RepID=A0A834JCQ8_VESGE|nr:hypothetical protein HZH68_014301 [Vespula germanica]